MSDNATEGLTGMGAVRVRVRPLLGVAVDPGEVFSVLHCSISGVISEAIDAASHGYRKRAAWRSLVGGVKEGEHHYRLGRVLHNHTVNCRNCNSGCRYLDYVLVGEAIGPDEVTV